MTGCTRNVTEVAKYPSVVRAMQSYTPPCAEALTLSSVSSPSGDDAFTNTLIMKGTSSSRALCVHVCVKREEKCNSKIPEILCPPPPSPLHNDCIGLPVMLALVVVQFGEQSCVDAFRSHTYVLFATMTSPRGELQLRVKGCPGVATRGSLGLMVTSAAFGMNLMSTTQSSSPRALTILCGSKGAECSGNRRQEQC